ncbi:MAG: two-component system response regulator KdpE [Herminiimonas sp.]|nr:two-component system response regulator KdpE [Herminiimonas sp.]
MTDVHPIALLVEDEAQIRRFVTMALADSGWQVHEASTLKHGLIEAATRSPDLIVLDLGLPDGDGQTFIQDFRQWSRVPIIVLSARTGEADKIAALDAGADDYLTKPFGVGELLARVRSAVRRSAGSSLAYEDPVEFGDVRIDLKARVVSRNGDVVHLTPTEHKLLMILVTNAGCVVTNRQLLNEVWGPSHADHGHYLRIFFGRLRQKLEIDPAQPKYLLTETAVGYRLILP